MKIIEALKELPLIDKKIQKNVELIGQYSSDVQIGDKENFVFTSGIAQAKEVASLVQSSLDLIDRRAKLKAALAHTNATTKVNINGTTKTITEWIEFRINGCHTTLNVLNALTGRVGDAKASQLRTNTQNLSEGVKVVRFFDEAIKNSLIQATQEQLSNIDTTLEIINVQTDLII